MGAHIAQGPCQERAGPERIAGGRRLVQSCQQAFPGGCVISGNAAGPEIIRQTGEAFLVKAQAPFADAGGTSVQSLGDGLVGQTGGGPEDDPGTLRMAGLRLGLAQPAFQLSAFGVSEMNRGCRASHAPIIYYYASVL